MRNFFKSLIPLNAAKLLIFCVKPNISPLFSLCTVIFICLSSLFHERLFHYALTDMA